MDVQLFASPSKEQLLQRPVLFSPRTITHNHNEPAGVKTHQCGYETYMHRVIQTGARSMHEEYGFNRRRCGALLWGNALCNYNSRTVWKQPEPTFIICMLWLPVNAFKPLEIRRIRTFKAGTSHWGWIGCDLGCVTSIAPFADSSLCGIYLFYPSMLSSKPPDPSDKTIVFTSGRASL